MVERHEPVTWADHRLWYYPLPYQALVAFSLLWALDRRAVAGGSTTTLVRVVLGAVVVGNVAQLPEKLAVMEACGIKVTKNPSEMGRLLKSVLK